MQRFEFPYTIAPNYAKKVAYFSMEFALDQALKTYSGGLGFLAGSHMKSAAELHQNMIGIGVLWKYGYYDQVRQSDNTMTVLYQEKSYHFLEDIGIIVPVYLNKHLVWVRALYLKPEIFNTVPMFFLTTDIPENDYLARTTTHRLYDSDAAARIGQFIVLGIGGAKVVEEVWGGADVYHINEAHGLPAAFHLLEKYQKVEEVKKRLVFTTHTPEEAGNEVHETDLLDKMGFFANNNLEDVKRATQIYGSRFNLTVGALRMAKIANGVSQIHGEIARNMWKENQPIAPIISITNAQNQQYWQDKPLRKALDTNDDTALIQRKKELKKELFTTVADQTGKLFDENVLTIVWARRFAGYKRADLLLRNLMRFNNLTSRVTYPVQIIWAGKPYPFDESGINTFNHLVHLSKKYANVAVLTGYELSLSAQLKKGADIWLNTPRRTHEASGTSGMTAAMNGAINCSTADGWVVEFAKHKDNSFILPPIDIHLPIEQQDSMDYENMMLAIETEIIPTYYEQPQQWLQILKNSMKDITPQFGSNRMADEYYQKLYNYEA
jgi:starch phosphorylase